MRAEANAAAVAVVAASLVQVRAAMPRIPKPTPASAAAAGEIAAKIATVISPTETPTGEPRLGTPPVSGGLNL